MFRNYFLPDDVNVLMDNRTTRTTIVVLSTCKTQLGSNTNVYRLFPPISNNNNRNIAKQDTALIPTLSSNILVNSFAGLA